MGLIDIHQHVIYGVDDGPRTMEASLEMLRQAQQQGITHVIATSHAYPAMEPFPARRYLRRLGKLRQACREQRIPVTLHQGCEIFYSDVAVRQLEEGQLPTLGGTTHVLVEFDPTSKWETISGALTQLTNRGFRVVVAHCERYPALYSRRKALAQMSEELPIFFQLNAGSLLDRLPFRVRRFCDGMLDDGLISFVASDGHNGSSRPIRLKQAYELLSQRYSEPVAWDLLSGNAARMLNVEA